MKELKVGMYVRTRDGEIGKITHIETETFSEPAYTLDIFTQGMYKGCKWFEGEASYNIIDLIEEGDYVNGYKVTNIYDSPRKYLEAKTEFNMHWVILYFYEETIYDVVTKEKFEEGKFRVRKNDEINNN